MGWWKMTTVRLRQKAAWSRCSERAGIFVFAVIQLVVPWVIVRIAGLARTGVALDACFAGCPWRDSQIPGRLSQWVVAVCVGDVLAWTFKPSQPGAQR